MQYAEQGEASGQEPDKLLAQRPSSLAHGLRGPDLAHLVNMAGSVIGMRHLPARPWVFVAEYRSRQENMIRSALTR